MVRDTSSSYGSMRWIIFGVSLAMALERRSRGTVTAFSPAVGHIRTSLVSDEVCDSLHSGRYPSNPRGTALCMAPAGLSREDEIRRKIMKLKKEGRIKKNRDEDDLDLDEDDEPSESDEEAALTKLRMQRESMRNNPVAGAYADKLKEKLGKSKGGMMGVQTESTEKKKEGMLGRKDSGGDLDEKPRGKSGGDAESVNVLEQEADAQYDEGGDDDDFGMSEEDLVNLVAEKLAEKEMRDKEERLAEMTKQAEVKKAVAAEEREAKQKDPSGAKDDSPMAKAMKYKAQVDKQKESKADGGQPKQTTTGIGGSWAKNETAGVETRRPSRGSWGYFERPNDISKAYGGGKRVGAGYTPQVNKDSSVEETRALLQRYREKVGIEVESEKEHAAEIEEALGIASRAMERGVYGTAVSALEKVTKYCSTNSKVGGKVFLELGMAYEAVGRTQEAISVYKTLTTCRIEDIKFNAKRLLYGIEAMNFMRNEAGSKAFSKKKVSDTFIETTGMKNFAENFDDRYNTAWIDMESGFYKQLTESVVRGVREARQIVLQATGSGEVDRRKVVQALRAMSRYFDDALEKEIEENAPEPESVAVMNGKPIVQPKKRKTVDEEVASMEKFILASPDQMVENLNGEWKLQLFADRRGDGVQYFNTSLSWQTIDTSKMKFQSSGPAGFLTVSKKGGLEFNDERRIISRTDVQTSGGGGLLSSIMAGSSGGAASAPNQPQQVISVDSVLLVTRYAGKKKADDSMKEYFCVWRRVEPGTYTTGNDAKP